AMSTEFVATIRVDHVNYGPAELTLRGIVSYEPPPSWENEASPFAVEYVQNGQSTALSYSAGQEALSYMLDEMLVTQGNAQLILTPNVAGADLTAVTINGVDVQKVNGSYVWDLPESSSDLYALINVYHPSYGSAELTLRGIVSYEPPPSWEDEAAPFTIEHMLHGYNKTLGYSVSQQESLSFMLGEALVAQGSDQLVITPNVTDATILAVTINGQSLQGGVDRYMWTLHEEVSELVIEINMSHPIYGNEAFTLHGNVVMPPGWDDVAYPLIPDFGIEQGDYVSVPFSRNASDSTLLIISVPMTVLEG